MNKQDLTKHSDKELSLVVMNDEVLYNMRKTKSFKEYLNEFFVFTDEQWEILESNLK